MGVIVFKQWFHNPNESYSPRRNADMVKYIATRLGVDLGAMTLNDELQTFSEAGEVKNKYVDYIATRPGVDKSGEAHGLFGKLHDMDKVAHIDDLDMVSGYVQNLTENKTNIFNAVLSFTPEDAAALGLETTSDWISLIERNINMIAEEMGIPPRHLEWCGAVHPEVNHPHLHLMYWDSEQKIMVNEINPEVSNRIRQNLTKDIYPEEWKAHLSEKDRHFKTMTELLYSADNSLLKGTKSMPNDIKKLKKLVKKTNKKLDKRLSNPYCPELALKIKLLDYELKEKYPQGALKFDYLPTEIKDMMFELAEDIILNVPQINAEFTAYLREAEAQAKMYGGKQNVAMYVGSERQKLLKAMSNKILGAIKENRSFFNSPPTPYFTLGRNCSLMLNEITGTEKLSINRSDIYKIVFAMSRYADIGKVNNLIELSIKDRLRLRELANFIGSYLPLKTDKDKLETELLKYLNQSKEQLDDINKELQQNRTYYVMTSLMQSVFDVLMASNYDIRQNTGKRKGLSHDLSKEEKKKLIDKSKSSAIEWE